MQTNKQSEPSFLLVEEYFASEDARFLECIRSVHHGQALASFADRWKKDPRPWARHQILDYLACPMDQAGHEPVVKRLFKHAEKTADVEIMAAFLVLFDQLVRREIHIHQIWNFKSGQREEIEELVAPRNVLPKVKKRAARNPLTGEVISIKTKHGISARLFKYRTRYYLRRRAWRFFRHLGFQHPEQYIKAIAFALKRYTDFDLKQGENILDSWGLLHACYGKHPALDIGATYIGIKEGFSLNDLTPAPVFADLWKASAAANVLLDMVFGSQSRLVRLWAIQMLGEHHANAQVSVEVIFRLLEHEDAEVQQFGATILEKSPQTATFTLDTWFQLFKTRNAEALLIVCQAFETHVMPDRLSRFQCMELACSEPVSIARLGLRLAKQRLTGSSEVRQYLVSAANAKCQAIGKELADWALSILGNPSNYATNTVIQFFDSLNSEVRSAAWDWLIADSPGLSDPVLWSRISETPYEDLKLRVIDYAQRHWGNIALDCAANSWRSVILGVHRGGRQKVKAVRQVANAIIQDPGQIQNLLPVLTVAVRSVRGPESKAGLSAIMSIVEAHPELIPHINAQLPELRWEIPS